MVFIKFWFLLIVLELASARWSQGVWFEKSGHVHMCRSEQNVARRASDETLIQAYLYELAWLQESSLTCDMLYAININGEYSNIVSTTWCSVIIKNSSIYSIQVILSHI